MQHHSQAEITDSQGQQSQVSFGLGFWLRLVGVAIGPALTFSGALLTAFVALNSRVVIVETRQAAIIESNNRQDATLDRVLGTQQVIATTLAGIAVELKSMHDGQTRLESQNDRNLEAIKTLEHSKQAQ